VGVVAKGADKASIDKASLVPHPRDPPYEPSQLAHSGPRVVGLNGELSTRGQGHPDAAALADVDTGQCCSVSLSHTRGGGRESVGEKRVVLNVNSCLRMHVLHVICVEGYLASTLNPEFLHTETLQSIASPRNRALRHEDEGRPMHAKHAMHEDESRLLEAAHSW